MDRTTLRRIIGDMEEALAPVAEAHDIEIIYKGGTYGDANAIVKFQLAEVAADGNVLTREAQDYERLAERYGLDPDWLWEQFHTGGKTYTIVGLKTRAKKYPVLGRADDGRTYKFPAATVRALMNMQEA